jgi:hypothetical protein
VAQGPELAATLPPLPNYIGILRYVH